MWYDRSLRIDSTSLILIEGKSSAQETAEGVYVPDDLGCSGGKGRVEITCRR